MTRHEPNLDMISAYLDGGLSADAARSMDQHLQTCSTCTEALDRERAFLVTLDVLGRIEPPSDFVEGTMGRVSQYPAYRPVAPVPWQLAFRWAATLTVLLFVLLVGGTWGVVQSGVLTEAESGGAVAYSISRLTDFIKLGLVSARDAVGEFAAPIVAVAETVGKMALRLSSLATGSSWLVQGALLLLTVMLNYAFTRLVLSYQRRH